MMSLILSRMARHSCPARDHTSFSLFTLLLYTHSAEMFSGQEGPELINSRERWGLKFAVQVWDEHLLCNSGSSSAEDGCVQTTTCLVHVLFGTSCKLHPISSQVSEKVLAQCSTSVQLCGLSCTWRAWCSGRHIDWVFPSLDDVKIATWKC